MSRKISHLSSPSAAAIVMASSSSGDHAGAAPAISRFLKVLVPSAATSGNLRIPDELAQRLVGGDDAGGNGTAVVVSLFGKIWRVQVGRDADGRAFLGRGWPEFAAAHGFGVGWFLVFRHDPGTGGVLAVKAFDTTCCLREFSRPLTVPANHRRVSGGASRRPQFIMLLLGAFMEKMLIPPEFVRKYIPESEMKSSAMILLSPQCKFCQVGIEKDGSGNVFFSGGWLQFLVSHGVDECDVLLLRCEGSMVFTVKVFGPNGCQKVLKDQVASHKQLDLGCKKTFAGMKTAEGEDPPPSIRKCKSESKKRDGKVNSKRPKRCTTSSKKALLSTNSSVYEIGPPSWMKRKMSAYILTTHLVVAGAFCKAIGLQRTSEITLTTTADEGQGLRSWKVSILLYENRSGGHFSQGWRKFCADNGIKEGDICTFNIVKTTLWQVGIKRHG
ncbi:unnamed protein product [Urochloa decumbens]|uniref:TF-B3 domain-containing protein n=1 Tax=Urochloa decumbens TaxID=240449 RepID=A0ABC9D877_9POAL